MMKRNKKDKTPYIPLSSNVFFHNIDQFLSKIETHCFLKRKKKATHHLWISVLFSTSS